MKKLAILVLALVMCLTAVSAMAATVAKVGEVEYTSLSKAVKAALATEHKTVKIVGNVGEFAFSTDLTGGKTDIKGLILEGAGGKIVGKIKGTTSAKQISMAGVTFKNLTFEGAGRIAFTANHASSYEGMVIEGCKFTNTTAANTSAINIIKSGAKSVDGLIIRQNEIDGYKNSILLNGNGGKESSVSIIGNTIKNEQYNAMQLLNIGELIIKDNKILGGNGNPSINVKNSVDVFVSGNDITMAKDDQIVIDNVTGVVIYDKSNALKDKTGATVQMDKQYVASGNDDDGKTWKAADNYVAINPEYNGNGQYVGGIFVGQPTAFADEIAGDLVYDGANNRYVLNKVTAALGNLPQTGDAENLMMWVALMAMAMVGLVAARKMSRQ